MKRLFAVAAVLAALISPAFAAGTLPGLSNSVQFDTAGRPMAGCLLYVYDAATTTPRTVYSDSGLAIALPNPLTCDGAGRLAFFYVSDSPAVKVRLTNSAGVDQLTADNILVIGPSGGGGGGTSVDATTVLATGDIKVRYSTGTLTGFVRMNGRTIGSATSGATERANADTQSLFEFLWTNDSSLSVSGGRGGSANADWLANKTIALPDLRGRALHALDDMGNSAAGRLTATYWGGNGIVLGQTGGAESRTLVTANLPPYTPAGTIVDPGHTHNLTQGTLVLREDGGVARTVSNGTGTTIDTITVDNATTGVTFTGTAQGGTSTAFNVMNPALLVTVYIKL